jgi:hypothetical protein
MSNEPMARCWQCGNCVPESLMECVDVKFGNAYLCQICAEMQMRRIAIIIGVSIALGLFLLLIVLIGLGVFLGWTAEPITNA